jgi:hypothetical protein
MRRLMLVGALLVTSGCAVSPLSPSVSSAPPQASHVLVPVTLDRDVTPPLVVSAPPVVVPPAPAAPVPPPQPVVAAPQPPPPAPVMAPAPGVATPGQPVPPAPVLPPGFNPTPSPICGLGIPANTQGCIPPPCAPGVTCGVPQPMPPGTKP